MTTLPPPVPPAWVADLFRRFSVLYGAQRMAVMYPEEQVPQLVAVWSQELARFSPAVVAAAVADLPNRERAWPPTLPEFVAIVSEHKPAPEHRRALPVPSRTADDLARGRQHMDAIKAAIGRRSRSTREPGCDDELPAPPPACHCWTGSKRAETLCAACSSFRRNRDSVRMAVNGTAEERLG